MCQGPHGYADRSGVAGNDLEAEKMKVGSIDERKANYVGDSMKARQAIVRLRYQTRMRIKLGNDFGNDVGNDGGLFCQNQHGGQDKQK